MGWLERVLTSWAELDPREVDDALHPVTLPIVPAEALARVVSVVGGLPRWEVVAVHEAARLVQATHVNRLGGRIQDVSIQVEAVPGGSRVAARSQSRAGRADLGRNRRNLRELTEAVRAASPVTRPEVVGLGASMESPAQEVR
jgi:uncharacterized protein (DUF1499 family)